MQETESLTSSASCSSTPQAVLHTVPAVGVLLLLYCSSPLQRHILNSSRTKANANILGLWNSVSLCTFSRRGNFHQSQYVMYAWFEIQPDTELNWLIWSHNGIISTPGLFLASSMKAKCFFLPKSVSTLKPFTFPSVSSQNNSLDARSSSK